MTNFEETHIYNKIGGKNIFYKRFIDDIFMVWNGTVEQLKQFIKNINTIHPTIKFDAKYSVDSIDFLDTHIYKTENGKLCTTLHIKPTDRHSYLHHKSYHPTAAKLSIVYSQSLRIRRICTEDSEYDKHSKKLIENLTHRGYKQIELQEIIANVFKMDRQNLLQPQIKNANKLSPIIVTYHKNLPNIKSAINKNWNILKINEEISSLFDKQPSIAFRKNKNLRQILCKHHLKQT